MGVTTTPSSMGLTPVCNDCGIYLCWDIPEAEYEVNTEFWDAWICEVCNGGTPFTPQQKRAIPPLLIPRKEPEMNVYKKLQTCRKELKALPVKESGNNKFAGYTYMELGDFLPHIVDLCESHGLCTVISFKTDCATLTVVNSDKPDEQIVFESPMSTAQLKGCHEIQNLGAVETYLRRYLYVSAFDIVEHDALDSVQGAPEQRGAAQKAQQGAKSAPQGTNAPPREQPQEEQEELLTEGQRKMIFAKIKAMGADEGAVKAHFKIASLNDLPKAKVNEALKFIEGK